MKKKIIAGLILIMVIAALSACNKKMKEESVAVVTEIPTETVRTAEDAFNDAMLVVKTKLTGFSLDKENIQQQMDSLKDKQIKDIVNITQDMKVDLKFAARVRANREIDDIKIIGGFATDSGNQATALNLGVFANDVPSLKTSLFVDLKNTQLYYSDERYDSSSYEKNKVLDDSKWKSINLKELFDTKISQLTEDAKEIQGEEDILDNAKEELNYYLLTYGSFGNDEVVSEDEYKKVIKMITNFEWSNTKNFITENLKFTGSAENGQAKFEKKLSEMIIPISKDVILLARELQSSKKNEEELSEMEAQYNVSIKELVDFLVSTEDPKITFTVNFSEIEGKLQHVNINLDVDKIQFDKEGETKVSNIKLTYSLSLEDQTLIVTDHMKNESEDITEDINVLIDNIKESATPRETTDTTIDNAGDLTAPILEIDKTDENPSQVEDNIYDGALDLEKDLGFDSP